MLVLGLAKSKTVQETLFGAVVPVENDENADLVWVNVKDVVGKVGDTLTFPITAASYNAERECITLFGTENTALCAWIATKYPESDTDAIRLGKAAQTFVNELIETWEDLTELFNSGGVKTLKVLGICTKEGMFYRRWTLE